MTLSRDDRNHRPIPRRDQSRTSGEKLRRMPLRSIACRLASRYINAWRLRHRPGHRDNIAKSRAVLRQLRSWEGPYLNSRCFAFLRKVDPLIFEEMVLTALEDCGLFVWRNVRYTGDGGIDGKAWHPRHGWCAVQVKRYRQHVSADHVRQFAELVATYRYPAGLFVHSGRSGAALYQHLGNSRLTLISGERLLELLLQRQLGRLWQ